MTLGGFFLGRLVPDIERHLHWVIGIVIVVSLVPIGLEWRRAHSRPAE
jgi:membrane-associated protein